MPGRVVSFKVSSIWDLTFLLCLWVQGFWGAVDRSVLASLEVSAGDLLEMCCGADIAADRDFSLWDVFRVVPDQELVLRAAPLLSALRQVMKGFIHLSQV